METRNVDVFLNCPFDLSYEPMFEAILFTVHKCGFRLRSAKEAMDSSTIRMDKILDLIGISQYSIHDLSRVEFSGANELLPRFNMPLELGCAIGCKRYGNKKQKSAEYLILVAKPNQYQKFISDIAGQDPTVHHENPLEAIKAVRNWLSTKIHPTPVPSPTVIQDDFNSFKAALPEFCTSLGWKPNELTFLELQSAVNAWCG